MNNISMTATQRLLLIDELLELGPGTLTGSEELEALESWDSVAIVSFMVLAKDRFDRTVAAKEIANCLTVNDLVVLLAPAEP